MHFILSLCYEVFFDEKKLKAAYQQRFQTFIELPVESLDFIHAA